MLPLRNFRILLAAFAIPFSTIGFTSAQVVQWPVAGQGAANLRSQPAETYLGISNVDSLVTKWIFTTSSDVSATPTVGPSAVFAPDWSGNLFAIDLATGAQLWSHQISEYDGFSGAVSRVSPALYNDSLIIGDNIGVVHNGANVISVSQQTGALQWITNVDPHPAAIITGSPLVVGSVIYQGIASIEEGLATESGYACCTFRGSIVALDADTGKILWQTYTVPNNDGKTGRYSGGPIWQPPAVDVTRNQLYVGTGNNYSVPASVESCRLKYPHDNTCDKTDDYFDSALALNLSTGAVTWAEHLYAYDAWNLACNEAGPPPACPDPAGPDYDLGGSGPNLIGNTVGFGQKSGVYWALDPDTGATVWSDSIGPGGPFGGIQWGTASDGTNIYIASANSTYQPYTLISGQKITWGFWSAVSASNGKILWQTADPTSGTMDIGALSVANGIVYAGSFDSAGHMYALNSATGQILWSYASGGSIIDGPSIVASNLFWGSGYRRAGGVGNNKVYDFTPAPAVTVTAPVNGSQVTSPVQFTASAASPNCTKGVASMRIYSNPGVDAYTVDGSSLNTSLTLSPGTYDSVVQSWDNCGNVGKTFVTITVNGAGK
jgi:polyvinyl alcohol dehydrogenase (cytochrome)